MNAESLVRQWTDVHGIEAAPVARPGQRLSAQRSGAATASTSSSSITITGMAHGTPLATGTRGLAARPGPFLLESGISSSYHIAKFFGLTGAARATRRHARARDDDRAGATRAGRCRDHSGRTRRNSRWEVREPKFESAADGRIDVMAIITKALTSAGLMKPPR